MLPSHFIGLLLSVSLVGSVHAQKAFRPVPRLQTIPLPNREISFQREGAELTRYHFDPTANRPFLYPVNGPSGHSLTRMGHPRDPESHSHHNSLWISHHDVNGVTFWGDQANGRIVHQRVERFDDGDDACGVLTVNHWVSPSNGVMLIERRLTSVQALPDGEWLLILNLRFDAAKGPVTFGKTPFGLVGVRMAKSIGVSDGGGLIRNSEGGLDEAGVFWKPARWVDYSGPIKTGVVEGITLLDHPSNPRHPAIFHVRNDGWMGASLTHSQAITIGTNTPLRVRYGFYVHGGLSTVENLQKRWTEFSRTIPPDLSKASGK